MSWSIKRNTLGAFSPNILENMAMSGSVFWGNGWLDFSKIKRNVTKFSVGILLAWLEALVQTGSEHLEKRTGGSWSKHIGEYGNVW